MSFLTLTALFLTAALIFVPLAKRLGLSSVLGYLAAGLVIGPHGFGLVTGVADLLHFAEIGIVFLLFLIGLELRPVRLFTMRRSVFGVGGAQVAASALLIGAAAMALGLDWRGAFIAGLALALSSTAFALQLMAEKGHLGHKYGRAAFSILLFQDIAAIPIIAVAPFFGAASDAALDWTYAAKALGAAALLIIVGRYVLRRVMDVIVKTGLRELFTASALLTVVGAAVIMQAAGLSMALGAFLAGVLFANSRYRHALQTDIDPFKGLLLGLFFMAVGMSVNLEALAENPWPALGGAAGLIALKALVLYALGAFEGMKGPDRRYLAVALSQGGEFAFVILTVAVDFDVIAPGVRDSLVLMVVLSMALTPFLFLAVERLDSIRVETVVIPDNSHFFEEEHPVIIAGFGRFGQIIGRMLRAKGIGFIALEKDPGQVDFVTGFGAKVFYGDASRVDLLARAGAEKARVFVMAVSNPNDAVLITAAVRRAFPKIKIIARARDRDHAIRLTASGADHVVREMFYSSLNAGRATLESLGLAPHEANYVAETFRDHDEERLLEQRKLTGGEEELKVRAREWADELAAIFADDDAVKEAAEAAAREKEAQEAAKKKKRRLRRKTKKNAGDEEEKNAEETASS
ncbi:MAG: monovalent cation:proton antiporter-2 (CPA2) family protein [Rhodospirillales bacterium]